jgi:pectinesterase
MKQLLLLRKHLLTFFFLTLIAATKTFAYDVVVAQDGSGDFLTVQAAINAAPAGRTAPYTIFIKNGKYVEVVNIPSSKPFLQLIGESVSNTIITFNNFSGKPMPGGGTFGTANSATVTIAAADVVAINITFENTTGESPQALAINVTGERVAFKNCRFLGGQDTVFAGGNGARQYFRNCYIDGTVDFIFGDARAVFDSCVIYAKTRSSAGSSL